MNNNDFNNEENSNDSLFGRFENAFSDALHGTSSDIDLDEEYLDDEEYEEEDDDSSYDWDRERESSDDNANESNEVSDEGSTDSSEEVSSDASEEVSSDTNEEIVDDSGETTDVVDADDSSHLSREDGTDERANHADDGLSKDKNSNDNVPDDKLNRLGNENGPDQNKFKNDQPGTSKGSDNPYGNPSDPNRLHHNNLPNNGNPAGNAAGNVSEKAGEELAKKGTQEVGKKGAEEVAKKGVEAGAKVGTDAALGTAGTTAAGTTAGTAAAGTTAAAGGAAAGGATAGGAAAGVSNPVGWIILGCIAVIIIIVILIVVGVIAVILISNMSNPTIEQTSIGTISGEICPYVTVVGGSEAGVYKLDEYVAGVVASEFTGNAEAMKAGAIAARSYYLASQTDCTIGSSQRQQVFKKSSISRGLQYAEATSGMVITSNGNILKTEYDALAYSREDENNVYIMQKNQAIPLSWLNKSGICKANLNEARIGKLGKHGRGLSQCGAAYLADAQGYNYSQLIKYYYGNEVTIGVLSQTYGPTQADGILAEALETYLPRNGSSIDALNSKIYTNVRNAGVGTREGVVAAATTLIETMDSYGVKLPYSNGGGHGHYLDNYGYYNFNSSYGVNPAWGKPGSYPGFGSVTRVYTYFGLDCSGFVSWAIHNGGFAFRASSTGESYGPSCNSTSASCKSKPGDLLLIPGKHVMLIIGESGDTYTVAEAMGGDYGILITTHKKASKYEVVNMDNWYANNKRVDSYPY